MDIRCRMLMLSLALLVLEATADLGEKEELCRQCNCAAINSSLSCFSDPWQSLNCKISHTKECPGNFSLFHGASPGCFKTRYIVQKDILNVKIQDGRC